MLLLVRHAHAGEKHRWPGPDSLRPLSASGEAEATWLLEGAGGRFRLGRYLPPLPLADVLTSPSAPQRIRTSGGFGGTGP
jgi:phosphohistidine phosphatase SixA